MPICLSEMSISVGTRLLSKLFDAQKTLPPVMVSQCTVSLKLDLNPGDNSTNKTGFLDYLFSKT